jgi:homocysteine S-methyltransferase
MADHPGLVRAVHRDFLAAGATVITANTYALHRDRFTGTDFEPRYEDLIAQALQEAEEARSAHGSGRIAGSIGPLVASYRPDVHPPADKAMPAYAELARLLAPACDLIICETVASVDHARGVLAGAAWSGKPVWLAVTVDDDDGTRLRSGEPLADVLPVAGAGAEALLVNCSAPEAMPAALDILATGALPYGAYANGFAQITKAFLQNRPTVDDLPKRPEMTPDLYARHAMGWIAQGATIVGGCCEIGPAHIETLARAIRAAGHRIV